MNRNEPAGAVLPEYFFLTLGTVVTVALVAAGHGEVAGVALVSVIGYALAVRCTGPDSVFRIVASYAAVWPLYSGSGAVIDALHRPNYAPSLLAWDRQLFGESPAVTFQTLASPWMNEILSAAYLSYLVYLHWFLLHAMFLPPKKRRDMTGPLFMSLGIGFSLYLVVPASGISVSFPELFEQPLQGFWITSFLDALVARTAAPYDCFPSVHVLATGVMLSCDVVHDRRRFWIMLLPSLVMVAATILLRMHYAVDLIASGFLLVPFVLFFIARKPQ